MVKTLPVPCTKEEMDKILDAAMDNDFYYLLFKVARKTGRRLGEYWGIKDKVTKKFIGGVQVKDIDWDRKVMMTQVLKRRAKVFKEALLDDELIALLKRYIKQNNLQPDDYLFRKVSYRGIQFAIAAYTKKANIPHKVSFHNFRHYFITELSKLGYSHSDIAKLTGHSTVGVIANYDHTIASDIRDRAIRDIKNI